MKPGQVASASLAVPAYAGGVPGCRGALDPERGPHAGNLLIVSSGGPIATAVAQVLGASPATSIELNMRIRNSALTELAFTARRHMLVTFDHVPHPDRPDRVVWVTHS